MSEPLSFEERLARLKLLVFDVDGVMTDGALFYGPEGEAFKRFDVKDGHGIVMARLAGLQSAILTARTSKIVERRGEELKMVKVMQGKRDKGPAFLELCAELKVKPEEASYMGDDTNDVAPMVLAGFAACPADAAEEAQNVAHFVSEKNGGHGAVRELVELVLKEQKKWDAVMDQLKGDVVLDNAKTGAHAAVS